MRHQSLFILGRSCDKSRCCEKTALSLVCRIRSDLKLKILRAADGMTETKKKRLDIRLDVTRFSDEVFHDEKAADNKINVKFFECGSRCAAGWVRGKFYAVLSSILFMGWFYV